MAKSINSSLVLGLAQYLHDFRKCSKSIRLPKKKNKADPTTTVLSLMKKLQLWGYLKIYLQLNASISAHHCHTQTGMEKMEKST